MTLQKILSFIDHTIITGSTESEISLVTFDSRNCRSGSIFIARKGLTTDSHEYIPSAMEKGCCAIVGEVFSEEHISLAKEKNVTLLTVEDSAYAGGVLVAGSYDFPFTKMHMIGVTGTDGKTTTSNLIYHLLKSAGKKVGVISTLSARIFDGASEKENDTGFHVTTPDVEDVQRYLSEMVQAGCEYAVVECTSHGFAQERLAGINFNVGVVTNITHEHLDYHKTLERYILAKSVLYRIDSRLPASSFTERIAIINQDDRAWEYLVPYTQAWNRIGYGYNDFAQYHIVSDEQLNEGLNFVYQKENEAGNPVEQHTVHLPLYGKYNILNAVAALACISELGLNSSSVISSLSTFSGLSGRFEKFKSASHGLVVVDFAHTPHALEEVLRLGRTLSTGKVTVVFGCAGLRDIEKRYLMGEIAAQLADITIITVEDPRTESLDTINERIARGLTEAGAEEYPAEKIVQFDSPLVRTTLSEHFPLFVRIDDREKAIESAITLSSEGDIVLVCGKGHEKSMNYGAGEVHWSDQEVVQKILGQLER